MIARLTHDWVVAAQPVQLNGRFWEVWGPRDAEVETCAIITTEANELCARVHDRMPVILASSDYERWLDTSDSNPADLLRPYPSDAMSAYPVSARVSSPENDDAELIEPLLTRGTV